MDERFTATLQKSLVKAEVRRAIGKDAGDSASVRLRERLDE